MALKVIFVGVGQMNALLIHSLEIWELSEICLFKSSNFSGNLLCGSANLFIRYMSIFSTLIVERFHFNVNLIQCIFKYAIKGFNQSVPLQYIYLYELIRIQFIFVKKKKTNNRLYNFLEQ